MIKGRRFLRFWIYLFLASGTGCAGCGNCFDTHSQACAFNLTPSFGLGCDSDSGYCSSDTYDASYRQSDGGFRDVIRTGLVAPGGLATDGVEVYYVDNGVLTRIENDGSAPAILATGVDASGGLVSDGVDVYWSGTWSGRVDGGLLDGGADAGATDAGDDAGDDAGGAPLGIQGVFSVPVDGGDVVAIAALPVLPTLALDEQHAFVRAPSDDGGGSALIALPLDTDAAPFSLATLSQNTGNIHAFALRTDDVAALDNGDIVSVLLDGGGKSTLEADAGSIALLPTDLGAASIVSAPPLVGLHVVGRPGAGTMLAVDVAAIASRGSYVYVADASTGRVFRFDVTNLSTEAQVASWPIGETLAYLAAGDDYVYLLVTGSTGGFILRASLF